MHTLDHIKNKDAVTTGDALLAIIAVCRKYTKVLDNIIRIREQHPEESADSFRKKTSNTNQLSQLHQIIDSTHLHMNQMANNILGASESGLENYDSAVINQQIIRQLDATIASLETAYTGKARSFTVVLNEFELLSVQFKSKLDLDVQSGDYVSSEASAGSESGNTCLLYTSPSPRDRG